MSEPEGLRRTLAADVAAIIILATLCSACVGVGARTVTADRFDYTTALSDSWKRQMLINVVKLRYGDAPVFLDVSSVIESYELTQTASLGANYLNNPVQAGANVGATGVFSNRPTISYSPLSGDKFARSLMAPVPPAAVLGLIQSGYAAELVLRVSVQSVNGLHNERRGGLRPHPASPQFLLLAEKFREIQAADAVGVRSEKLDKTEAPVLVFNPYVDERTAADIAQVRELLHLAPDATEFSVVYGLIPENDKQVALLTRSMLEILAEYSSYVEVPEGDVAKKRVTPNLRDLSSEDGQYVLPIAIHSSSKEPKDVFVAVPYRDHWFWIGEDDITSKRIFSFLMFTFTLIETGEKQPAPIVSLPLR